MVTTAQAKKPSTSAKAQPARKPSANGSAKKTHSANTGKAKRSPTKTGRSYGNRHIPQVPSWLATVASVVGVGVAVGAGLYATRRQWMSKAEEWRDNFSAAFADEETDYENFDQTRHAGRDSMRDDPGNDWGDIDDMSDASFPASDPPSFNPGTA